MMHAIVLYYFVDVIGCSMLCAMLLLLLVVLASKFVVSFRHFHEIHV